MKRRAAVLVALVACAELRAAKPTDDAGVAEPNDGGSVRGDARPDAPPSENDAEPPCPEPCRAERLSKEGNLGPLVLDGTNAYFGGLAGGIYRCPKTGCGLEPTKLADDTTTRIAIAGEQLFWGFNEQLRTCKITGCDGAPTTIVKDQLGIGEVMSDAQSVVWSSHIGQDSIIRACSAASCTAESIAEVTKLRPPHPGFGIGAGKVFWPDLQTVALFCPLDPLPCPAAKSLGPATSDIVIADGNAYWVNNENVVVCPLSGCQLSPTTIGHSPSPHLLAVDAHHVYWRELVDNQVVRCAREGCEKPDVLATSVESGFFAGLALDEEYVYWTSRTGLWRRHK